MKHALVTGGAGFIGSHLVDRLISEGVRVVVVDDLSTGQRQNVPDQAEFHQLDIRDPKTAELIAKTRPDAIFHLAAQKNIRYSLERPAEDADINITGSVALLDAARRAGVKQFVFTSSGGAIYDESETRPTVETARARPLSPYGIAKRSVELYLEAYAAVYGMSTLALRLSNVYGPRQDPKGEAGVVAIFSQAIIDAKTPSIFGKGNKTRDYVYVDDIVEALWSAAQRSAQGIYNIGTGIETKDDDLWAMIAAITRTTITPDHTPEVAGELKYSSLSAEAADHDFGWRPKTKLDAGLRRTCEWFQNKAGSTNPR